MEGGMQFWPLTVTHILDHASRWHGEQQVVSRNVDGKTVVHTYRDIHRRARLCALSLRKLGCRPGSVVATLAWNTARHMECWYGISGLAAVCHTLNPRLSDADLTYIINDAEDAILMSDFTFVPILERILPACPSVKAVVLLADRANMPGTTAGGLPLLCYEDLLQEAAPQLPTFSWVDVPETTACGLCYTSGTTGRPKGVLYSHRSNYLHALVTTQADALSLSATSVVLPIVPLFHANAWGLVHAAPMVGARLVLPGPFLDGESVYHVIQDHAVTVTAGVPTVWLNLLAHMEAHGLTGFKALKVLVIGGAAAPPAMITELEDRHGIEVRHMWGMTELSPLGSLGTLVAGDEGLGREEVLRAKLAQGRPHVQCDFRIVDDTGRVLPHDGNRMGNLQVRGSIVVQQYHKVPASTKPTCDPEGWFDTGDVATIDAKGRMRITDRSKDVIKSGGEWMSSIEVECAAMSVPGVAEAAVIGIPDAKWGERPLLIVVPRSPPGGQHLTEHILETLRRTLAKWCVPDAVVYVKEIPHTATGKISKLTLRKMFKGYKLPTSKL